MSLNKLLIERPLRPGTPLNEKQRTLNFVHHSGDFIASKHLPLTSSVPPYTQCIDLCRYSGGGDVHIISKDGVIVISGTSS